MISIYNIFENSTSDKVYNVSKSVINNVDTNKNRHPILNLIKKGFLLTDLARKAKKTHKYITTK